MGIMSGYYPEPPEQSDVEQRFLIVYDTGEEEEGNISLFDTWASWNRADAMTMNEDDVWIYNKHTLIYCTAK